VQPRPAPADIVGGTIAVELVDAAAKDDHPPVRRFRAAVRDDGGGVLGGTLRRQLDGWYWPRWRARAAQQ
jgi:hypothetical protein